MSNFEFYINIEDSSGNRFGDGPITSASGWTYTARMDRAGSFSFQMPATDPKAALVQKKRVARAFALLDSAWVEVGAGVIDDIQAQSGDDGITWLAVVGDDLLRELTYRSVLDLKIYFNNAPISHAAAVAAVGAFAPAGWTFTPDPAPPNSLLYGRFNGHSVLAALIKIAEKTENHFYRSSGRTVVFASTFAPSGVRAIQAGPGDLASETAAIKSLTQQVQTYDLITRIYPRGSGNGDVQLTLKATTRTAPAGFVLNKSENYIESTAASATYGRIEQQVDFREIGPIENTTADIQAAANMLFDAALEELKRRSTELELATYTISLDQCSTLLRPMQSIFVDYSDPDSGLTVRQTLNILEATWSVDESGVQTTGLVVSSADRWPASDASTVVDSIEQAFLYQALPQLNANSYTTGYTKHVDAGEVAGFRFRFGREVVQLQQVLFEFQLLPFESTVKAVGGPSGGAGAIPTSGPNVDTTGTGGVLTTGTGGPTATDTGGPTATGGATGETGSSGAGNTGGSSPATGSTAPNTGSGGGDTTGLGGTAATGSSGTLSTTSGGPTATGSGGPTETGSTGGSTTGTSLETNEAEGGDTLPSGFHVHGVDVGPNISGGVQVYLIPNGDNSLFAADGGQGRVPTTIGGDHIHSVDSHTHSINSHTHDVNSHTHSVDSHTHSIDPHTHGIGSHTHTTASHTHTTSTHTHTTASHTHTTATHTHTVGSHTHTVATHTHTIAQHTHSLSQHTHSLADHSHDLSDSIETIYGIFRESAANTYDVDALEYRVNNGSWTALNTSEDAGSSWRRLDITDDVMDADSFRPLQEANLLEIRAAPTHEIVTIEGVGGGLLIQTTPEADENEVGSLITVSGTTNYNGTYRVGIVTGTPKIWIVTSVPELANSQETAGDLRLHKTVTVDALLSVRNIIQSVALT